MRWLVVLLVSGLLFTPGSQSFAFPTGKTKATSKAASKSGKPSKKISKRNVTGRATATKKQRAANARRIRRANRAFIASASLKPMAVQLLQHRSPAAYAGVERFALKNAKNDAGAMAWMVIGYARILDRDYAKAISPLKKAAARQTELQDYVTYFLATAYGGSGQPEQVVATLRNFETEYPNSIFLRDAVSVYAGGLLATGQAYRAAEILEKYRSATDADIELTLGRAYVAAGDKRKGAEILRFLYLNFPSAPQAADAWAELQRVADVLPMLTYAERRQRADVLFEGRRYREAARHYEALLQEAPEAERTAIEMARGVALFRTGERQEARRILEGISETQDEWNARRLLALAEMARSDDDQGRFQELLGKLRQDHRTSPAFEDALLSAGNWYLLKKDYESAIAHYRELQERFPTGKRGSYAHWKTAWLTYRQGRRDGAYKLFERQVDWYPEGAETAAALYWTARLAEEKGELPKAWAFYTKAAERFRQYYYAELSRERLKSFKVDGEVLRYAVLEKIPPVKSAEAEATINTADNLRVERSRLLVNAGLTDLAIRELRHSSPNNGWHAAEIARIYREAGQYHRAIQTLKRAIPSYFAMELKQLPREYWESLFPRPFWTDLRKNAELNGFDPYLIASLIRQESEFNPGAVSHANAWGLMQVLPGTGKLVARDLRMRRFRSEQLLSPTTNLQIGSRYFRQMVDRFGGRVEYALAAYNAGSHRVDQWLQDGQYRDVEEFVESIPFTETREYVQAILRNAAIYRRLYGMP